MTLAVRQPLSANATIAAILVVLIAPLPAVFAQVTPPGARQHSLLNMESAQHASLVQEVAKLKSRLAQIQTALDENRQGGAQVGMQPVGVVTADKGMSGAPSTPPLDNKNMPAPAGCCAGMMEKMGAAGSTAMSPDLPGFPGASTIYHLGATGFFLDYSAALKLTADQQAALNGIKEKSIGDVAAGQRTIDQAEQELWTLTGSDRPDSMTVVTTVREIEKLKGDQRIAFIHSVGEAARVLTDDQRAALLGTAASGTAPMAVPQPSTGAMNPQSGVDPMAPKSGMSGDPAGTAGGGKTPDNQGDAGMGDM